MLPQSAGFTTRAVHAGEEANASRAVATPIFQTATYRFDTADEGADMFAGRAAGHVYSRWSNPNVAELEAKVATLEGAEDAVLMSSGMAAIAICTLSCPLAHLVIEDCEVMNSSPAKVAAAALRYHPQLSR